MIHGTVVGECTCELVIEEGAGYKEILIIMDTWPGIYRKGDGNTMP